MRFLFPLLIGLMLSACSGSPEDFNGKDITGVMDDLAFTLVGEDGEEITEAALENKAVVMFFGYTHCPDFCPMTLTKLAQAMEQLDESERDNLRVLFISVDPARDTPEQLREYTGYYGSRVIGATGESNDDPDLKDVTRRYRTAYGFGEPNEDGDYEVSHGLAMYGFDDQGKVRLLMNNDQPVDQVAEDLKILANL